MFLVSAADLLSCLCMLRTVGYILDCMCHNWGIFFFPVVFGFGCVGFVVLVATEFLGADWFQLV